MLNKDYYGSSTKWFIGVVKDVTDPAGANRVRVRIKGIHSEDSKGDGGNPASQGSSGAGTSNASGSGGGSTNSNAGGAIQPKGTISIDESKLPDKTQLSAKISKHWTLGQLTVGATVSGGNCRSYMHLLDKQTIKNLSFLATNVLDPLKEQFPGITVTSGWRPRPVDTHGNHASGCAADVQCLNMSGKGIDAIFNYIKNNLKGRYTFNFNERNHVHIQCGGGSAAGSFDNPVNKVK